MSTAAGGTGRAWKPWGVVMAVLLVVAGLLHVWRNTNVLTEDRVCGGLVSAEQANGVLPGAGRIDAEGDGLGKELTDTVCRIEKSSVVLGSGEGALTLRVRAQQGMEILGVYGVSELPETSFFSGAVTGGVDDDLGWALLPEECWATQPVFVGISSTERISDREAFAALTTDTARAIAAGEGCGDLPEKPERLLPPRSDAPRPVSEGRVCGLGGLSVSGQVPEGVKVLEAGQKAPADLWSCKLTLDDDSRDSVRAAGFMAYSASRDPLLIAAVKKTPGTSEGKAPDGRRADLVGESQMILPCAEGDALYLAVEAKGQYWEARELSDLPPSAEYVEPFVQAAAKTFGCTVPAEAQ
ncbi:hypothetical protein AB0E21_00915 [Streptomyces sp. NPDC047967]|uniref:hypothetical protein n=1 Tax=Streptomyces sp. NPDC047967 TaxID=3154924 RepID=UPI0033D14BCF